MTTFRGQGFVNNSKLYCVNLDSSNIFYHLYCAKGFLNICEQHSVKLDLHEKAYVVCVGTDSARMDTLEKTDWCNGR